MSAAPPSAPQSFPYDYLFKVLIIGDASVGKVRTNEYRISSLLNTKYEYNNNIILRTS